MMIISSNCAFEFLAEELVILDNMDPAVKEFNEIKEEKPPKYHRARQYDLAKNNVPIIPDKKVCGNRLYFTYWSHPTQCEPTSMPINSRNGGSEFIKDYILGNVHRPDYDGIKSTFNQERAAYHRITSLYDKQRDWAWIERKIYNKTRRDNFDNKDTDPVDWRTRLGDPKNILLSKYAQNDHYYKFIIGTDRFVISKVIMPCVDKKDGGIPEIVYARAAIDYATGNFFTSVKDAKRSILFQKLKTFFKYIPR